MMRDEPQFRSLTRDQRHSASCGRPSGCCWRRGWMRPAWTTWRPVPGPPSQPFTPTSSRKTSCSRRWSSIRGVFLGKLRSPDVYAAEPVEAVALFCGRFLELVSWRDSIGYQRVALAAAARSPAIARAVYDTLFAEACRCLAAYSHIQADPSPRAARRALAVGDGRGARDPSSLWSRRAAGGSTG